MALRLGRLFVDIGANTSELKSAEGEVKRINKRMGDSFSGLGKLIATVFTIEAARRVIAIADNMALLDVRVKNATKSQRDYNKASRELIRISNETGTAIADNITLFEKLSLAGEGLNASNDQVIQITENFNKLGTIGGSSLDQMKNSQLQFSQAMAGGVVRAEEFNSILENTPFVAREIAKGLGKSVGELRKMVIDGELLSEDVFNALLSQTDAISDRFETLPITTARSTQQVANNFSLIVAEINKGVDGSVALANKIQGFADIILELPNDVRVLFTIIFSEIDQFIIRSSAAIDLLKVNFKAFFAISDDAKAASAIQFAEIVKVRDARIAASKAAVESIINDELKLVAAKRGFAGEEGLVDTGPVKGSGKPIGDEETGPTKGDLARLERIRQLGESERQEIERITQEQREFILSQDQLTADARQDLLEKIALERNAQLEDINIRQQEKEAQHQDEVLQLQQEQSRTLIATVNATSNAVSNLLEVSGNKDAARAAAVIQGVASLATTIVAISAAQAQAQSLSDPTAVTLPQKIANVAIMASQFAGIFAALDSAKGGGRQFGGATFPSLTHPINEAGVPEILNQGGKQFLLPTGKSGNISPLKESGSGGTPNVTMINNGTPMNVESVGVSRGEITLMINDASRQTVNSINTSLATGRGDTSAALRRGHRVERNLG